MVLLISIGCVSALVDPTPYLDEARVVAVRMDPAEAEEGEPITLTALYADATGPLDEAPIDWSFCAARRPLAESGPVASSCLDAGSADLVAIGTGAAVDTSVPDDVCSLFGPDPPPPDAGGVAGRPVDPDVSGGYYQPVLAFVGDDPSLVSARTRCGPANVTQETYVAWNLAYHDNENPDVDALTLDGAALDGATVAAGATVTLAVAWGACPAEASCGDAVCSGEETLESCAEDCTEPVGCSGAETYALLGDDGTVGVVREAMSVAWVGTGGVIDAPRGGRDRDEAETTVETAWTAPDAAGTAWIGAVVRDDRGGVGYAGGWVTVE